jgi:hypothetical protein
MQLNSLECGGLTPLWSAATGRGLTKRRQPGSPARQPHWGGGVGAFQGVRVFGVTS